MKKVIACFSALCLSILMFTMAASAESNKVLTVSPENAIEVFDPYVTQNSDGDFVLSIPEDITLDIDSSLYNQVMTVISITNQRLDDGLLAVAPNGTLYKTDDDYLYVQGGVDSSSTHWWGYKMYMCTDCSNEFNHTLDQAIIAVEGGGAVATTVGSVIFAPVGIGIAIGAGVQIVTLKLIYNDAVYKNANPVAATRCITAAPKSTKRTGTSIPPMPSSSTPTGRATSASTPTTGWRMSRCTSMFPRRRS